IAAMLNAYDAVGDCGIAGPVFRYPDGLLQEAGAFLRPNGDVIQRGKFDQTFSVERLAAYETVDYVSGACLMIRPKTFCSIGGFDERFDASAYYEDVDLCMRVRQGGLTVQLARDALCYHLENTTIGRQSVSDANR